MDLQKLHSSADVLREIDERGLHHVKVGVFDIDGVLRGKYMSRAKFESALKGGFGFCDVVLGWDSNDELYDNVSFTGWHTGYPDAPVNIVAEATRELPLEDNQLLFLGEFTGEAEKICPRGLLKRVVSQCQSLGFEPYAACEYEFFVFDETPQSVREKNFRNLNPIAPGAFGYSVLRNSTHSDFYLGLIDLCRTMDFDLEGLHEETGPGVLEAAIAVSPALEAGDKAALFKTFTKIYAQHHERIATFMAKWTPDWPGQSGHIHMSLKNSEGGSAFHDPGDPNGMSESMRHFVGGQQALLPELLAMVAPTVNSYTRLIPGFWAPTDASWGIDNRTCSLRVIPGSAKSQRVEYRLAAADCNPYLGLAAALASGLWGIENRIEPSPPVQGNAYDQNFPTKLRLPSTLWDAAQRLKKSKPARSLFGDEFVDHFSATREWEEREFRKHISDWELNRYFEII